MRTLGKIRLLLIAPVLLSFLLVSAESLSANDSKNSVLVEALRASPSLVISEKVQETHTFYGLASYFNGIGYYIVSDNELRKIDEGESIILLKTQWFAAVGRLNVLLIRANGLSLHTGESTLALDNPDVLNHSNSVVKLVMKQELPSIASELDQIRYNHLWGALAVLANLVEISLVGIQAHFVSDWGMAIVAFSVLLKTLLLPIEMMNVRFRRQVGQVQELLGPQLAGIKANYDGEEAHNRLMMAHKDAGVSPFFSLKLVLGPLIQLPIQVAIFNALSEMPQLSTHSFLWIESLAYPDTLFGHMSFGIPMLGDTVSLLPFIMTIVALYSTIIYKNRFSSQLELKSQKRNLYLMAVAIFLLFYPFPSAMVLYWTLANILQAIQHQIIKV
jgi:YidC/Oxa1 family membrane protein insertase